MKPNLYEVWGDTVDASHLVYSIVIGATISLSMFFIAQYFFVGWVSNAQMARAYAMLAGIVGCLIGGAISARLFKPKRHVVEHQADPAWRMQVLIELQNEFGDLGNMSDLPPATIAELREIDLYDLFADHENAIAALPTSAVRATEQRAPVPAEVIGVHRGNT